MLSSIEKRVMLTDLIPKLGNQRILIIGDVILDEYLIGNATRMSREAPIPILEFDQRRLIAGGAANPAANISALGSTAIQIGLIGTDEAGDQLAEVMASKGIVTSGLIRDAHRPTTVKTRIMAQMGLRFPQQVARLDRIKREPLTSDTVSQIQVFISQHINTTDAILCSDYHAGMLSPALVDMIRSSADNVLLAADAQGELGKYQGFGLVKCNADEARLYLGRDLTTDEDFTQAALQIRQQLDLTQCMAITRGSAGMTLATKDDSVHHIPASSVTDVFDTVGAGDTTIAVITLALAAGISPQDAARLANAASGLVVRRVGNYTPTQDELIDALKKQN